MPYSDRWDTYTNGTVTVALDTITKIIGTSSLALSVNHTQAQANLVPTLTGGLPQPALRGKIRNVIRVLSLGGGRIFGLAAVQSARNITTSGSAYLAYLNGTHLTLGKITAGLSGTITILGDATFDLVTNLNYVLELEWNVDNAQLGGVDLTAKVRSITDLQSNQSEFTNMLLTTSIHKIDKTAPLLTTLGQGLIFVTPAFPSTVDVRYDSTILFAV